MADLNIKRAPSVDSNQRAWSQVYDDINDIINFLAIRLLDLLGHDFGNLDRWSGK